MPLVTPASPHPFDPGPLRLSTALSCLDCFLFPHAWRHAYHLRLLRHSQVLRSHPVHKSGGPDAASIALLLDFAVRRPPIPGTLTGHWHMHGFVPSLLFLRESIRPASRLATLHLLGRFTPWINQPDTPSALLVGQGLCGISHPAEDQLLGERVHPRPKFLSCVPSCSALRAGQRWRSRTNGIAMSWSFFARDIGFRLTGSPWISIKGPFMVDLARSDLSFLLFLLYQSPSLSNHIHPCQVYYRC
jgi:hypothetical protein